MKALWPELPFYRLCLQHQAIEGVKDRITTAAQKIVELRSAILIQNDDLAIQGSFTVQRTKRFRKVPETFVDVFTPGFSVYTVGELSLDETG